jgi:drug/metabolite transporter (DMT)-like permease
MSFITFFSLPYTKPDMQKKNLYLLLLIIGTAFWGISFPVTKMAIGSYSKSVFLFYRFAIATLAIMLIFHRQLKHIDFAVIKAGAGLAFPLVFGIHFQTLGIVMHSSASQCAFVAGMCVVIVPLLKMLVYRTRTELRVWLAALLALAGLAVISLTIDMSINTADAYVLTGTAGFAWYLIRVERYASRKDITLTLLPMFATGTFLMLLLGLSDNSASWMPDSHSFWSGAVYCSLFATAYMYSISNISQKYIPSEKVALVFLFEPVFAAFASFLILEENLSWRLVAGGSLILIATFISEMKHLPFSRKAGLN